MSYAWMDQLRDPQPWSAPQPLPGPIEIRELCVRLYRKGDGPALHATVDAHRASLLPEMIWVTTDHQKVDDSIYYVENCRRAYERPDCLDFPMAIFHSKTGELVGGTGLHHIVPERRQAEIGYWIRGIDQNKGFCTRAIGALISAALRPVEDGGWGLRRILVFNNFENVRSRRVCEKLGLRLEMRMRKERYFESRYLDFLGFAVLSDEWDFDRDRAKPYIGWT